MFNPSDLEGEVDHSFFDSDCDDSSVGRGDGKKIGKDKQSKPGHEWLHAKQTKNTEGAWSPRTEGTQKHLKPLKNNSSSSRAERKENSCHSNEEERRRVSSIPVSCTSDKVINNSSDGEEDYDLRWKMSKGTFMASSAEAREADDKDVYSQSPNESEEEVLLSNAKHSKGRNKQTPKKRIRSRYNRSPSPTSTEASMDSDSESSCSSSNRSSSLNSPKPNKSSLSPGGRRIPVGSARTRDVPALHKEESDDTITDVSPLSSPDSSLLQSLDLNRTEAEEGSLKEQQQQQEESVPSSGLGTLHQDEDSDPDEDQYSLSSVSQLGGKLVFHGSGGRNRKNYSFTNEEVRSIDHENQRLLRALSRLSPGPNPGSKARKKSHVACHSPLNHLAHSALNRQREQQRIERENLAFLKRLESVKPTPGLKRTELLPVTSRMPGAPLYSVCMSTAKKGRSASKTPSDREISLCCPHQQVPGRSARPTNPFPGQKNWVLPDQPGAENNAVLKKHIAGSL